MNFREALVDFKRGMAEAAEIFHESSPDAIIAPMMGSVPFIDAMHIVGEDFDPQKVFYMPASSGIAQVQLVMRDWMGNFLDEVVDEDHGIHLMGIDEVVSGSSATRVYRAITDALRSKRKQLTSDVLQGFQTPDTAEFRQAVAHFDALSDSENYEFLTSVAQNQARGRYLEDRDLFLSQKRELVDRVKAHFAKAITYRGVGIQDQKMEHRNMRRTRQYQAIREEGGIIPVGVDSILTMDKPQLCPAVYRPAKEPGHYTRFSPVVGGFEVTPAYVRLLNDLAQLSGKNPEEVAPVNMPRILESARFLSPKFQAA